MTAFSLTFLQWTPLATLLHLEPLHWDAWLIVLTGAVCVGALARMFLFFERKTVRM